MTSTAESASRSARGVPSVEATEKSRERSRSAARASEESAGCEGCILAARSGSIVQASEWPSSKRTGAILPFAIIVQS